MCTCLWTTERRGSWRTSPSRKRQTAASPPAPLPRRKRRVLGEGGTARTKATAASRLFAKATVGKPPARRAAEAGSERRESGTGTAASPPAPLPRRKRRVLGEGGTARTKATAAPPASAKASVFAKPTADETVGKPPGPPYGRGWKREARGGRRRTASPHPRPLSRDPARWAGRPGRGENNAARLS